MSEYRLRNRLLSGQIETCFHYTCVNLYIMHVVLSYTNTYSMLYLNKAQRLSHYLFSLLKGEILGFHSKFSFCECS